MLERARDTRQRSRRIFEEIRDMNPGVPIAYDANLERAMQRARRSAQLPLPRTIDEAQASLIASELYNKTADGTSNFYHGRVSTPSGTALVFISLVMLPLLRTSEEIACDGTFATLPLLFSQLFMLHVSAYRAMFPLAYAVMSEKTKSLYQLVLDRILLRTGPGEGVGIIRMVSDYEFAILNAMEHAFPGGHSRGCWFYFGQAICRKVCTEGIRQSYMHRPNVKKIVKMLVAFAFLPAAQAMIVTPESPHRFSVNGQPRRTTNESFFLSFWTFIEYLQKVEAGAVKDYNLARSGRLIRREHSRKQTEKDARIRTFCQSLDNREITVCQFLEMCSGVFETLNNPAPLGGLLADPFDSDYVHSVSDESLVAVWKPQFDLQQMNEYNIWIPLQPVARLDDK
ncbi:Uncharacterized protein APZ42_033605 [Daphnia magna]|uniref:MULE transposase domain-containing protein n=1 Tax=Daphnia magna TaxID=35525 RepID=A0A164KXC1_9CRUS|nr:Uncharacterized protein APZ42_033605 [Daphnia magna]